MAQNYLEYLASIRGNGDRQKAQREQRLGEVAAAEKARMVVDHPGWQMYLDHLEAICTNLRNSIEARKTRMIDGNELDADLTRIKLEVRAIEAQLAGIELAMKVVPEIIKRGEDASSALNP